MKEALFLVLPSVDEPFPMVVLEALSVGLPVIVTKSCGLADAIVEHECGLVIWDSVDELAEAIATLLDGARLRTTLSQHALGAARCAFSMHAVAETLLDSYSTD